MLCWIFLLAQVCQSEFDFQKDLSMKITRETKERSCNNSPHAESKHFISKWLMHAMRAYVVNFTKRLFIVAKIIKTSVLRYSAKI